MNATTRSAASRATSASSRSVRPVLSEQPKGELQPWRRTSAMTVGAFGEGDNGIVKPRATQKDGSVLRGKEGRAASRPTAGSREVGTGAQDGGPASREALGRVFDNIRCIETMAWTRANLHRPRRGLCWPPPQLSRDRADGAPPPIGRGGGTRPKISRATGISEKWESRPSNVSGSPTSARRPTATRRSRRPLSSAPHELSA